MILPDVPPNTAVGPYLTVRRIGQGARGVVYLAQRPDTGREVALKILGYDAEMDVQEVQQRFEREAATLATFSHPNIVAFDGTASLTWHSQQHPCLAMEYLPDLKSLTECITQPGDLNWVLDRFDELLAALEYMHAAGVVHRDLKPANLGIPLDGRLRVLDLGMARVKESKLTNQGTGLGSLGYMAPEQLMDARAADHRADIYAVGMVLLEALGGHPLGHLTNAKAVRAIVSGTIPRTPNPIPEGLDSLARWFAALRPEERPASARAARGELIGVRRRMQSVSAAPPPTPPPVATPTQPSVASFLGQHLAQTNMGHGGAILLCGQSPLERRVLIDATSRQAESLGLQVVRVQGSPDLAAWLGCSGAALDIFRGLAAVAQHRPTLVCIDDLAPGDVEMSRLMDVCAQSGERVLMVVATAYCLPAGAATVYNL